MVSTVDESHPGCIMINIMSKETIPVIQEQISEMEKQINQVNVDVSNIYSKIEALEIADTQLKDKIDEIEGKMKSSMEQNITDVTNQFNNVNVQIEEMLKKMEELTAQFLRYRYEEESNTLYLYTD